MMATYRFRTRIKAAAIVPVLSAALLFTGCASVPPGAGADPRDPWEGYNRTMTQFNDSVDKAVVKPVATVYVKVVPSPVRTGVSNFFGNIGDVWSFVNNLLQANVEGALYSFWRVAVNTTFGLGGILDPASEMRLDRHSKDFGLTLGRWGVPPGPYLVLPLMGPSTLRDTAALPVNTWGNLTHYIPDVPVRNSLYILGGVNTRAQLLGTTDLRDQAALDPYSFTRDAFLQKRRNDVYNGNPPPEDNQNTTRYDQPDEPGKAPESPESPASPESPQTPASAASAAD
jgi:phospholipid-binding lipoprotein MlaA